MCGAERDPPERSQATTQGEPIGTVMLVDAAGGRPGPPIGIIGDPPLPATHGRARDPRLHCNPPSLRVLASAFPPCHICGLCQADHFAEHDAPRPKMQTARLHRCRAA